MTHDTWNGIAIGATTVIVIITVLLAIYLHHPSPRPESDDDHKWTDLDELRRATHHDPNPSSRDNA